MSVVITHARSEAEGRPLAEGYCHARGAAPYFKGIMQYRTRREILKVASFECLPEVTPQAQAAADSR